MKIKLAVLFVIGFGLLAFYWSKNNIHDEVHLHAGFQVYKDDVLQDFSSFEYMNFTPCGEHDTQQTPEEKQLQKAHLHDFIGDVVHVHTKGATWGDLFINMGYDISPSKVYINGEEYKGDIRNHEIAPYDSIVIIEGPETDINEKLANSVTRERIEEAENKSEYCGS